MYRRVAASDDAELVPLALRNLAVAQYKQGLLGEAKRPTELLQRVTRHRCR